MNQPQAPTNKTNWIELHKWHLSAVEGLQNLPLQTDEQFIAAMQGVGVVLQNIEGSLEPFKEQVRALSEETTGEDRQRLGFELKNQFVSLFYRYLAWYKANVLSNRIQQRLQGASPFTHIYNIVQQTKDEVLKCYPEEKYKGIRLFDFYENNNTYILLYGRFVRRAKELLRINGDVQGLIKQCLEEVDTVELAAWEDDVLNYKQKGYNSTRLGDNLMIDRQQFRFEMEYRERINPAASYQVAQEAYDLAVRALMQGVAIYKYEQYLKKLLTHPEVNYLEFEEVEGQKAKTLGTADAGSGEDTKVTITQIVEKYIKCFNGTKKGIGQLMNDKDYQRLLGYVMELIEGEKMPKHIKVASK